LKISHLNIKNFKSIADLEIINPSPFTVFVGPNGSGKSNIFEALEFLSYQPTIGFFDAFHNLFGGVSSVHHRKKYGNITLNITVNDTDFDLGVNYTTSRVIPEKPSIYFDVRQAGPYGSLAWSNDQKQLFNDFFSRPFSRLFVGNLKYQRINNSGSLKLSTSADNLENVLREILYNGKSKAEISDWLSLFIPGFETLDIISNDLSGQPSLLIYEKGISKPFSKELISDGTYNILALLTAVYQSDEPQFLCIEEPENGLNPFVVRKLVDFFRQACQEKGHYIWLNTHSQTLVECLTPDEIILVDKIDGETCVKQIKGMNLHGLNAAEGWLSGALGGGTPW
jgi:predicted ATPase